MINLFRENPWIPIFLIVVIYVLVSQFIGINNPQMSEIFAACEKVSETADELQKCVEALR